MEQPVLAVPLVSVIGSLWSNVLLAVMHVSYECSLALINSSFFCYCCCKSSLFSRFWLITKAVNSYNQLVIKFSFVKTQLSSLVLWKRSTVNYKSNQNKCIDEYLERNIKILPSWTDLSISLQCTVSKSLNERSEVDSLTSKILNGRKLYSKVTFSCKASQTKVITSLVTV